MNRMLTAILLAISLLFVQTAPRTPTDTLREFYRLMRDKKFREAFDLSIYRPAIEGLSAQEFEDLRPDFEKMAIAVSEKIPAKIDISGEHGDYRAHQDSGFQARARVNGGRGRVTLH